VRGRLRFFLLLFLLGLFLLRGRSVLGKRGKGETKEKKKRELPVELHGVPPIVVDDFH
jgi:hypothetical protein